MTPNLQNYVAQVAKKIQYDTVLEIGSYDVNGTVRQYFTDASLYLGIDIALGPNVDTICDGHDAYRIAPKGYFDTILWLESAEHDSEFWYTLESINHLLRIGGILIVSTPTIHFPYHAHPKDYYRFTEDAYRDVFFKGYEIHDIQKLADTVGNLGIACYGSKLA